jgi:hypothetical protein
MESRSSVNNSKVENISGREMGTPQRLFQAVENPFLEELKENMEQSKNASSSHSSISRPRDLKKKITKVKQRRRVLVSKQILQEALQRQQTLSEYLREMRKEEKQGNKRIIKHAKTEILKSSLEEAESTGIKRKVTQKLEQRKAGSQEIHAVYTLNKPRTRTKREDSYRMEVYEPDVSFSDLLV